MRKKFEKIFWEVGHAHNLHTWWEIFDSEVFDEVEATIVKRLGKKVLETEAYHTWYLEMSIEL